MFQKRPISPPPKLCWGPVLYDECVQVYVHIYEKKPSQVGMKVEIVLPSPFMVDFLAFNTYGISAKKIA